MAAHLLAIKEEKVSTEDNFFFDAGPQIIQWHFFDSPTFWFPPPFIDREDINLEIHDAEEIFMAEIFFLTCV